MAKYQFWLSYFQTSIYCSKFAVVPKFFSAFIIWSDASDDLLYLKSDKQLSLELTFYHYIKVLWIRETVDLSCLNSRISIKTWKRNISSNCMKCLIHKQLCAITITPFCKIAKTYVCYYYFTYHTVALWHISGLYTCVLQCLTFVASAVHSNCCH